MDSIETNLTLPQLTDILHEERCSCVIASKEGITICRDRGVRDLFRILQETPSLLENALLADKVIGKGAAALMVVGMVKEVYADVISRPALDLLATAGIPVSYGECVPNIINRAATGICPVEILCMEASAAEECLPLIKGFLTGIENTN